MMTMTTMDGTAVTAMGMVTTLCQQGQWMAPRQRNGNNVDGQRDGDSNGNERRNDNVTMTMAMDSARAMSINGATATRWRGRLNCNAAVT